MVAGPRLGERPLVLAALLVVAGVASLPLLVPTAAYPSLSEERVREAFNAKGCALCHNGQVRPDWDGIVELVKEWARRYASIDEAVSAEYAYASFDELMERMKAYTPQITEEELAEILGVPARGVQCV